MSAATVRPSFYAAIAGDMASLRRPPTDFGGLGDTPLIVLTHGKPFPGPFAALEPFWRAGQERHAALSTRGALLVAENSNHMIAGDEPELVIEALRRMAELYRAVSRQSALEPSAEAVASVRPSGLKARAMTSSVCSRVAWSAPSATRHSRTAGPFGPWPVNWCQAVQKAPRARPPLASQRPSGLNATA